MEFKSIFAGEINDYISLSTSQAYSTHMHKKYILKAFDNFLNENSFVEKKINEDVFYNFINKFNFKESTKIEYEIILNGFIDYLVSLGFKCSKIILRKHHDDYLPYIFDNNEIETLINEADNFASFHFHSKYSYRFANVEYPVILRLLIFCGTRIGETVSIKVDDWDKNNNTLVLRNTKKKKERIIPLHPAMGKILTDYYNYMGNKIKKYLFPGKDDSDYISSKCITQLFNESRNRNNIDPKNKKKHERGACIHCLRHYFVLNSFKQAAKRGESIENTHPYLSTYLGHFSLNETEKYLKFQHDLMPEALSLFEDYTNMIFPKENDNEK